MASQKRLVTTVLFIALVLSLLLPAAGPSQAQATPPTEEAYLLGTDGANPATTDTASAPPSGKPDRSR